MENFFTHPISQTENFYNGLCTNTELSKKNEQIKTIKFDFQQNLPLPHISVLLPSNWALRLWDSWLWRKLNGFETEIVFQKGSDKVISCLDI